MGSLWCPKTIIVVTSETTDHRKVEVKSLSHVWLFAIPGTIDHQTPLSMEFSRQEYWSGLPFPSPEDLHNPGAELHIAGRIYTVQATRDDNKHNDNEKVWNIVRIIKVWHRDTEWANAVGKWHQ